MDRREEIGYFREPDKDAVQWFVINVKWRKEMEFAGMAERMGAEVFVAKQTSLKKRPQKEELERKETVAIPEIVFVRTTRTGAEEAMQTGKVRGITSYFAGDYRDGKRRIMVVRDDQMESFIKIASQTDEDIAYLRPDEIRLGEGDTVRIHGGLFDGTVGKLIRAKGLKGKRVVVSIEGVMAIASAEISADYLEVLEKAGKGGGVKIEEIEDLQRASEEMLFSCGEKDEAGMNARRKALGLMAGKMGGVKMASKSPSVALALLTYAMAVSDDKLTETMREAAEKHLEKLHRSALRSKIESILN